MCFKTYIFIFKKQTNKQNKKKEKKQEYKKAKEPKAVKL